MQVYEILERLSASEGFPTEAILAARANREAATPVFIEAFERLLASGPAPTDAGLFFAFHLLGEWKAKSAYRTLARFLQLPDKILGPILDDAITVTVHRVMAAVFDGDPSPLQEIVYTETADEFIRSRMIDATAILTLGGHLSRGWTEQFLRDCYRSNRAADRLLRLDRLATNDRVARTVRPEAAGAAGLRAGIH